MAAVTIDQQQGAEENFGECQLGDARRTRRAVKVACQMAEFPDGSTPYEAENLADLKAVYRLFDCDHAAVPALAEPHWKLTHSRVRGTVLVMAWRSACKTDPPRRGNWTHLVSV